MLCAKNVLQGGVSLTSRRADTVFPLFSYFAGLDYMALSMRANQCKDFIPLEIKSNIVLVIGSKLVSLCV